MFKVLKELGVKASGAWKVSGAQGVFAFMILLFAFVVIFPTGAFAQVVINEFSSDTQSDWVELYAFNDTDISDWKIDDDATSVMFTPPASTIIGPGTNSYFIAEVGNRLNRDGDIITLIDKDGGVIDTISYGTKGGVCTPGELGSIGRYPDANATIERFSVHTKLASNDSAALDPCPTPSPQPTTDPTAAPTSQPTTEPTPAPTVLAKVASPKPTKKPVVAQNTTLRGPLKVDEEGGESEVLALREELNKQGEDENGEESGGFSWLAALLTAVGVGFIGYAGWPFIKPLISKYNLKRKKKSKENARNDKPPKVPF